RHTAQRIASRLAEAPSAIALISGPSGAGKSTLLRALPEHLSARALHPIPIDAHFPRPAAVVDLFDSSLDEALRLLAHAGLAEAALFARTPDQLSDGQRTRLALALALDGARQRPRQRCVLIADEFLHNLDRPTARSVALTLRRAVRATPNLALVAATTHDDLTAALQPDHHVKLNLCSLVAPFSAPDADPATTPPAPDPDEAFTIAPAPFAAYLALARFHYRAAPPATHTLTLAAHHPDSPTPIGALVVSMPTLNAAWRSLAWPGRYSPPSREAAKRLNDEVRCISRIVIDPRFRARGAATSLIRHYLASPQTIRTEAVASMGRACPIFTRAGMTEHALPPRAQDERLLHVLATLRIPRSRLATPGALLRRLSADQRRELARAARTWANHSRRDRAHKDHDLEPLLRRAARTILANPTAYTHSIS
ncbi:MAG: AAA family ATPase, partial [Phycisphaerales bacterium]|nr:AAA family ATPase [Phycisphaerales bacterium]